MRRVYAVLAGLMLLAVLAQFYFAAVGSFGGPHEDDSFAPHRITGTTIIPVLSLLATIAAAVARAPGRLIGLTILPLGLVVVQGLIIVLGGVLNDAAGDTTPGSLAVLGLHAINGLAVLAVSGMVFRQARLFAKAAASAPGATTPAR